MVFGAENYMSVLEIKDFYDENGYRLEYRYAR